MNDQKDTAKKPAIDLRKIEEFSEDYANHILFQGSNWDMKLIFGELDQTLGHNVVLQHTAITIPWAQVKLLAYFLSVHLTLHEFQFGRIQLAENLVPEVHKQMPKESREAGTPDAAWQAVRQLYEQFIAANPEAAPKKR